MASKRSIGESRADKPRRPGKKSAKPTEGVKPGDGQQRQPFAKLKFVASEIVMRDPAELKPFPNNPKIHTPKQVDAIVANIEAFGFDQPTLIDEQDQILKGHGRHLACVKIGCQIPTIKRKGLSDADKWAIVISDNALPAMTGFDPKLLRIGLTQLAKVDYALNLTGFDKFRLAGFGVGASTPGAEPDHQPKVHEKPTARLGDVWLLGDHTLRCGNSEKAEVEEEIRLHLSDPPYELDGVGGGIQSKRDYPDKIMAAGIDRFDPVSIKTFGKTNVFFTSKKLIPNYIQLAIDKGLAWDVNFMHRANAMPNTAQHMMTDIDYIMLIGGQNPNRGLELANYSKMISLGHWERPVPWAKPVQVLTKYLRLFSNPGDTVLDAYCGSGSTIIACEMEHRRCLGFELEPMFVDIAIRRWMEFTKKPATLEATGKTFEQVARERAKRKAA